MKKTPFLSCILSALLACSGIPQARAEVFTIDDAHPVFDVGRDGSYSTSYKDDARGWMWIDFGESIAVRSQNAIIRNGGVSGAINIYSGAKLTMAPAENGLFAGELIQWMDLNSRLRDDYYGGGFKWPDEYLHIHMEDNTSLDYRNEKLYLGVLSFTEGGTVNITAGQLSAESIGNWHRDEFNINATINLRDQNGHIGLLNIENIYAKTINMKYAQTMNLRVASGIDYAQTYIDSNGKFVMPPSVYEGGSENPDFYKTRLNGCTLYLPDGGTNHIENYLGGTTLLSLGNGATLQGLYQARDGGGYNISWLLNNVELRENYSATMTKGYYGGTVTMKGGSTLMFDMAAIPAGVDTAKWEGGAEIVMQGGNTLNLLGSRTSANLRITVNGTGNTITNGTLTGSYTLKDVGLVLDTGFSNASISMQGGTTLVLPKRESDFDLTVSGTGNTLKNSLFVGTLTMKEGSRLEMVGDDRWINDISKLHVEGPATVKDAYLRIKPGTEYTLGNGVEKLTGEGATLLCLDNSTLNLNNNTTTLNIKVWSAYAPYSNVIKNGTINTSVQIDDNAKLTLDGATLGSNAAFTLGNGTALNLGGAQGAAWVSLADGTTATVGNGRVGLPGGTQGNPATYTLDFQNGKPTAATGCGFTLNLEGETRFATNGVTRFLVNDSCINKPDSSVAIDTIAYGHFILGQTPQDIGGKTEVVNGNVTITYAGDGTTEPWGKDVDIYYQLVGSLVVNGENGRINAGIIGAENDTASTVNVTAKQVYLSGFVGNSLTLSAVNNAAEELAQAPAIEVKANALAAGDLTLNAQNAGQGGQTYYGDIKFGGKLSGGKITLTGRNITGEGTPGDAVSYPSYLEFGQCIITAQGAVSINEAFKARDQQGELEVTAGGNITLDLVGMDDSPLSGATEITSSNGGITMRSFTGGSLVAKAEGDVAISGTVRADKSSRFESRGNITVNGGVLGGPLTAAAGNSVTLRNVTIGTQTAQLTAENGGITAGNFTCGHLTATAGQSIALGNIESFIAKNQPTNVVLTATNGGITAGSVTGGILTANAKGAVEFAGDVTATDIGKYMPDLKNELYAALIEGSSVRFNGSLTASLSRIYVKSTDGDISIGGNLHSPFLSRLDSKGSITIGTLDGNGNITAGGDVTSSDVMAKAGQSIQMNDIRSDGTVELTAENGGITAGSFRGVNMHATAKGAVTFTGDVKISPKEGYEHTFELTGGSVSIQGSLESEIFQKVRTIITSTAGDIMIGGTLNTSVSCTLDSQANINVAGDITGNETGGALTASAAGSITLENIGTDGRPMGAVDLTAQKGRITASSCTGTSLTATAEGDVTFSTVTVLSGDAKLAGAGVTLGSLTTDTASITSTAGDIKIDGALRAGISSTLESAQDITIGDTVWGGGSLTAKAGKSIALHNIDLGDAVVQLTATGSGITAGNITVDSLTATAKEMVQLGDVTVSRDDASIASTDGDVKLNTFSGGHATISAHKGSILVESAVSGLNNTLLAGTGVTFAATACERGLSNTTVRAPKVVWEKDSVLTTVTVTGVPETEVAQVDAGGSLTLKDNSLVKGGVTIGGTGSRLTVAGSTITGAVSGTNKTEELVLDNGTIGSAEKFASLASTGTSSITGQSGELMIPSLILKGGTLTLGRQTESGNAKGQALVTNLTVTQTSSLVSNLELNNTATFNFTLDEENTVTPLLTIDGQLTRADELGFTELTISLQGNASVEGGQRYALIRMTDGKAPDDWGLFPFFSVYAEGLGAKAEDLSWEEGILYFQYGTELTRAVWNPGENHNWNAEDKNWTQDNRVYRYKDGVDVVFNGTGEGGDVLLEGALAPKSVLVEGACDYTFKGDGRIAGGASLTKEGSGTLTIENANDYSGGTFISGGTLVVKNAQALGTGTVSLEGGTLKLANGNKDFTLVVTGTGNRMEGDVNNAFTGSLTLEEGSSLVSSGSLGGADAPREIVMKNGSRLEMDTDKDNWISDISKLRVVGTATIADAYLRIRDSYRLGNGVANLQGEGVTAYCLEGASAFNLDGKTANLDIIVWGGQSNQVRNGKLDTTVDIRSGSKLTVVGVTFGDNAVFRMENEACLDLSYDTARLGAFQFTGQTATIDNAELLVEDGTSVQLGTKLQGTDTSISLGKEANLDLNGYTLDSIEINLADDSATVSGGKLSYNVEVESGKALHLGSDLAIEGDVALNSGSTLGIGSGCSVSGAISGSGTILKEGGDASTLSGNMKDFTGSVEVQDGILNLMNVAGLNVQDVTIAANGTLGVYMGESADEAGEATLTIKGSKTLTAGKDAALNANLVMAGGSTLDVSAAEGNGGLHMGSTVTLAPGNVLLSEADMDAVSGLRYMQAYDLFNGVDKLSLDNDVNFLAELGLADKWVKAGEVFANEQFQNPEKEYYLFYSGANQGGAGGNVGTVYLMQIPEPATGTLSLLALAGLVARRRRK